MPDIDSIRHYLASYPGATVGFTIYRLTYTNDEAWERYMHHLNERVQLSLGEEGDGGIFASIEWDVQEDVLLKGSDDETVRA